EFLTLQNPDPQSASTVSLSYQTEHCDRAIPGPRSITLPGSSRTTIRVSDATDPNGLLGATCTGVGATVEVTSGPSIAAERPMYMVHDFGGGLVTGGHVARGATTPGDRFTAITRGGAPDAQPYLTIENTDTLRAVDANVAVFGTSGRLATVGKSVPAHTRATFDLNAPEFGVSGAQSIGVVVTTDLGVAVEVPSYSSGPLDGASDVVG